MPGELLDAIPLWGLFPLTCLLTWSAMEAGYRLGQWRHQWAADEKDAPVGAMVGAILGLLAFLLAFTFSLAAARYDERRQAVLQEANAIGTTYLRTQLLPEPQRPEMARLLREYVDVRVNGLRAQTLDRAIARSEELHKEMWSKAMLAAEKQPNVLTSLFVQSLNETIDVHARRVLVGVRSRIPASIWIGLLALALAGLASTGYQAGLSATRRSPAMLALVLAFVGVLTLIADLDRPGAGFLTTNQQAMLDLQKSMQEDAP